MTSEATDIPGEYNPEDQRKFVSPRIRLQRAVGGHLLEAQACAKAMIGPRFAGVQKRFVIFGRGRSGSTLLVSLLDQHPDVACLGEILRYRLAFPKAFLDNSLATRLKPTVGFKLLSYQMQTIQSGSRRHDLLKDLAASDYSLIYLRRDNPLRHALSNLYAKQRQVYHQDAAKQTRQAAVHLPPEHLLHWMRGSRALESYEESVLGDLPRLNLTYEQNLSDPDSQQATYKAIIDTLGLPFHPTTAPLRKVTPERLADIVTNPDEIRAAVAASEFRAFLDDPGL